SAPFDAETAPAGMTMPKKSSFWRRSVVSVACPTLIANSPVIREQKVEEKCRDSYDVSISTLDCTMRGWMVRGAIATNRECFRKIHASCEHAHRFNTVEPHREVDRAYRWPSLV